MRCSPLATEGGASIWITRSTAPMSMPSSSEEVATRPRSVPALRRSSICDAAAPGRPSRGGRGPASSPASSLSAAGQALGQAAAVDEDHRRAVGPDQLEQPRVDGGPDRGARAAAARPGRLGSSTGSASRAMSSTGTSTAQLERACARRRRRSSTGRERGRAGPAPPAASAPPRKRATSSSGRWVAERPMRCSAPRRRSASSRSSESARCAPRLVGDQRVDLVDDHRLDARAARSRAWEVSSR